MPIVVVCPCGAKLRAPDAAAGKRVKCPKCASPLTVPAAEADFEEVEDDVPPPAPPPAKKKPQLIEDDEAEAPRPAKKPAAAKAKAAPVEVDEAVDDDDEEAPRKKRRRDDDDEDDTPKKKGKKGKKKDAPKSKLPLILGIGGGVFVLLTVVGIIVGIAMSSGGGGGQAKGTNTQPTVPPKPALPPGWSEFQGEGFSVAVPDSPPFKKQEQPPNAGGPALGGGGGYTNITPGQPQPTWTYLVATEKLDAERLANFRKDETAAWEQYKKLFSLGGAQVEMKPFSVGGVEGREFAVGDDTQKQYAVARFVVKDDRQVMWVVVAKTRPTADDPNVKPFFDTFKFD